MVRPVTSAMTQVIAGMVDGASGPSAERHGPRINPESGGMDMDAAPPGAVTPVKRDDGVGPRHAGTRDVGGPRAVGIPTANSRRGATRYAVAVLPTSMRTDG